MIDLPKPPDLNDPNDIWSTLSTLQKAYIIDESPPVDLSQFPKNSFLGGIPIALNPAEEGKEETSNGSASRGIDFWHNLRPDLQIGIMNNYETYDSVIEFLNKNDAVSKAYDDWSSAVQVVWDKSMGH